MARKAFRCGAAIALLLGVHLAARAAESSPPPVIAFLDQAIAWYRQQLADAQLASEPADVPFADAARQQARQILELAFEYARAAVVLAPGEGTAPAGQGSAPSQDATVQQRAAAAQHAFAQAQAAVTALQGRLERAAPGERAALGRRLAEARAELRLATVRRDALKALADFVAQQGGAGSGASGLLGQIDELQRSVPGLAAASSRASPPPPAPATAARRAAPSGIVSLAADALSASRKLRALQAGTKVTAALRAASERQRAPLVAELRASLQGVGQPTADGATAAQIGARTRQLDEVTARLKRIGAALLPLGKQGVLLDAHAGTLADWSGTVDEQVDSDLRRLALHLGLLAISIAGILAASAAWRRATFRYVRDPRRRRQSLLVRRVIVAVALLLVILFSLVTEFGSIATLAGFITAGLAVALQNVILSVAAYFFLIGKYGISVGDRVQISGVTGDVMDIGLVRLHVMELRADGLPTGRVVVFSNAVFFQPNGSFFKQIPGTSYAWHQVTLTLSPDTDYRRAEERLLGGVRQVYARYRDAIERQHAEMAHELSELVVHPPEPRSQLRLAEPGLEMTIRFPVPLDSAPSVDDEVTRALLDAIAREPRLKLVGSGTPTIQAVPEPAPAPA